MDDSVCGNAEGAAARKGSPSPGLLLTPSDGTEPLMLFWMPENRDSALHVSLWAYRSFPLGLAVPHELTRHFSLSCRLTRASFCIRSPLISWRSRCTPWSLWCCWQWATWSSSLAVCRSFLSRRFCCALRSRRRFFSVEDMWYGIWKDAEGFRELRRAYPHSSLRSDPERRNPELGMVRTGRIRLKYSRIPHPYRCRASIQAPCQG
jgi:hypothetical protein